MNGGPIDTTQAEKRRDARNQGVKAAWVLLLIGIVTIIRPLLYGLPSLFTCLGMSLFTSFYFLTEWYADDLATHGLGIVMVFCAIAVMRGKAGWLRFGALLLSVDLALLILTLVLAHDRFYDTGEVLISLAVRAVTWWIVLRGSLTAGLLAKPATDPSGKTPVPQQEPGTVAKSVIAKDVAVAATAPAGGETATPPQAGLCANCGRTLSTDARSCQSCGNPIGSPLATATTTPEPVSAAAPRVRRTKAKKAAPATMVGRASDSTAAPISSRKPLRLILVATLGIVALVGFVYRADIDPASVVNSGPMPYRNIREDSHDLKFYFVEKDGKRLLYEETGQYYLE